jgi:hypothetical protein
MVWDWIKDKLNKAHETIKSARESAPVKKVEEAVNHAGEKFTEETKEVYEKVTGKKAPAKRKPREPKGLK